MKTPTIQPADRIGSLRPYSPPGRDACLTLALDNNEGAPVDVSVLETIKNIDAEMLTRYPDSGALEQSIAQRFGVQSSRVIITNGGDDAIDRICRATLNPDDTMLTHSPGFVMISRYAQLAGAKVKSVDWLDGYFPAQEMLDAIDKRTRLVALISPCNPTGKIVNTESILSIATKASSIGAVVLLDQAYIEFAEHDPINDLLNIPNLVIVRTFSKAMGLAGQRIGYAIGPSPIIDWLRTVGGPYPVSALSLVLAQCAFDQSHKRLRIISRTLEHRQMLAESLALLGITSLPSQANFVLARFDDAGATHAALLEQGISVRRFYGGGAIESYLRITVPTDPNQLSQLLSAFTLIGAK